MKQVTVKPVTIILNECLACSLLSVGLLSCVDSVDISLVSTIKMWLYVHLGPFVVLLFGLPTTLGEWVLWSIIAGIGTICILAYSLRPNVLTAVIRIFGIAGWFSLGVEAVMFTL